MCSVNCQGCAAWLVQYTVLVFWEQQLFLRGKIIFCDWYENEKCVAVH